MEYYSFQCKLCGEKFSVSPYCPCVFGDHLLEKHPDVPMTFFFHENGGKNECACCVCKSYKNKRGFLANKWFKMRDGKTFGLFKTTVETWRPGSVSITCPYCHQTDNPCIRKQRNKVAYSSFGAFWMLTCWPICFLPFLLPSASTIDLYCKHCGTFLGEYDRQTGKMQCPCVTGEKGIELPCVEKDISESQLAKER